MCGELNMFKWTIEINDAKFTELMKGINYAVNRSPQDQGLSDVDFFKTWVKGMVRNAYKQGKISYARESIQPDVQDVI